MSQNHPPNPSDPPVPGGPGPERQPGQPYPQQGTPYPGGEEPGSRFGTDPYAAAGQYGVVEEPKQYRSLLTMTLASLGLYVLSSIIGLLSMPGEDALREQIQQQAGGALDDAALEQAVAFGTATGIGIALVTLVIAVGLYLLVYFGLRKKGNWARILGIILAIVGTLFTVWGLTQLGLLPAGMVAVTVIISVLFIAVNIYWLVLAFNKNVGAYLRQANAPYGG